MSIVILSPHLDDAVLSCWQLLERPGEVAVINVFAGVPAGLDAPAWWDRYTGASDSAVRVRERIEEDRRALAAAGRAATNLTFLDEQYRDQDQTLDPLADELAAMIEPGTLIYAPAALGAHADHLLVRAAALRLRASGHPVALYADLPHASARGWPSWVRSSGAQDSQDLAGAFWDRALTGTQVGSPTVHRLGGEVLARKLAAVRAYATQLPALAEYSGRPLDDPEVLGYEVFWATAGPAHEEPRDRRYLPAR